MAPLRSQNKLWRGALAQSVTVISVALSTLGSACPWRGGNPLFQLHDLEAPRPLVLANSRGILGMAWFT